MKRFLAFLAVLIFWVAGARGQDEGPGGRYYQVVMEQLTWAQAKARAEGMVFNGVHGHLATITSAEEDQFIENLRQQAMPGGYQSLWVGGYQDERGIGTRDGWMWVNGEGPIPMPGDSAYSNWQPTEPNDYWGPNSEMFLSVGHFNMFGWNDEPNDTHVLGFVVEFPSGGTQTTVRISTVDAFAVESAGAQVPNVAVFEIRREGELALDLPVFYSIHGTARNGADYDEISQSVIIPAGQSVAHITIRPRADVLTVVEPLETVGIRLEPSPILTPQASYRIDSARREAGAVIAEGQAPANGAIEIAVPRTGFAYNEGEAVTLLAVAYSTEELVQATFVEAGMDVGTTVWESRDGNLFFYRVTMQNPLPGTHTVKVMARTPSSVLLESSDVTFTVRGEIQPAVVSIRFVNADTTEPVPNADYAPGYLEVTRSGGVLSQNLQVHYSIGGTATAGVDYEALLGYVVIAANRTSARINVVAIDDTIDEANETVILTLVAPEPAQPPYTVNAEASSAQAVIYDNDEPPPVPTVSIDYSVGDISEPAPGVISSTRIIIERSGNAAGMLRVFLGYGGTAARGTDYSAAPNEVSFREGQTTAEFPLTALPDGLREITEIARVRLLPSPDSSYRVDSEDSSVNIAIADNGQGAGPSVTIINPEEGQVFVQGNDITIAAVAIHPSSYIPRVEFYLGTILLGESRMEFAQPPPPGVELTHSFVWRSAPLGRKTIFARGYAATGQVVMSQPVNIEIVEDTSTPIVHITPAEADIAETPMNTLNATTILTVHRTGSLTPPLRVRFSYSGSAIRAADFAGPEYVVIPAGSATAQITIAALQDNQIEEVENALVILAPYVPSADPDLANRPYNVANTYNRSNVRIHDTSRTEATVVRITATDPTATEMSPFVDAFDAATFVISRTGSVANELRVFFSVHGTAEMGVDYQELPESVVIPAGQDSVSLEILPRSDFNPTINHYEVVSAPGLTWAQARAAAEAAVYAGQSGHLATIASAEEDQRIENLRLQAGGGAFWVGGYQEADELSITGGWKWVNNEGTIPGSNEQPGYANWLSGEPNDYWGPGSENHMVIGWLNTFGWNDQGANIGAQGYVVEWEVPTPLPPEQLEGMETVGLRLEPSPMMGPIAAYTIDREHDVAGAVIYERSAPNAPVIAVAIPTAGESMDAPVKFLVAAYHHENMIGTVDFYVDGNKVGTSSVALPAVVMPGVVFHALEWPVRQIGRHVLVAKAGPNGEIQSPETPFVIGGFENRPPEIAITHPADGTVILEGESAVIVAEALDVDGTVTRIELYADGNLLTTTTTPTLHFAWLNPPVGPHVFRARATDNLGATTMSAEVRILVRAPDAVAFVRRSLPAGYSPGVAVAVGLRAEPPAGAHAYAVEDRPPTGWAVSEISHGGVFDARTGKVKFGPFTDSEARTLAYRATPPAGATGRQQFAGASSLNGTSYPIAGDEFIEMARPHHPADSNEDRSIVLNEVTAYAAAWKAGETWPTGPAPIPLSYVTSAGNIWRRGEAYLFDPARGAAPDCWAPVADPTPMRAAAMTAATVTTANRSIAGELRGGATAQVQITVTPGGGTSSYAIEERPPQGWTVSNVSSGGVYDAESGVIRWGLFLDANSRLFSYTVTPPAVASTGGFSGRVSADGRMFEILSSGSTANAATAPIALSGPAPSDGAIVMTISGPQGQTGVLESTTDFIEWAPVRQVFLPNGELEIVDDAPAPEGRRFYRLRVD